jgi:hypothetical protein
MSYLEHEDNKEKCGCPSCDGIAEYNKKYATYLKRPKYRVVKVPTISLSAGPQESAAETERMLNHLYDNGYEMTAVTKEMVIFTSAPPIPPTNGDILAEYNRRKHHWKSVYDEFDGDDFGPILGGMQ